MNPLIGKTIIAVYLATDNMAIRFDTDEGKSIVARTDGDCCSHSWIESLDDPDALLGEVVSAEDVDMNLPDVEHDGEFVAFYGFKIATKLGVCVIDFRNESNGNYGGRLVWPRGAFYGGKDRQNISSLDWRLIVGTPSADVEPGR